MLVPGENENTVLLACHS